jgi:hypothetical protein
VVRPLRPKAAKGLIALLLVSATTLLSAPITLELTGGSVIKGDLVSWNGQQAVVKAEFGSLIFKREQLSQATLQRLDLLSGDPQKLVARIAELEATLESLRKDNAALPEGCRRKLESFRGAAECNRTGFGRLERTPKECPVGRCNQTH